MTTIGSSTLTTGTMPATLELRSVSIADALARPMFADLAHEYSTRYRDSLGEDAIRAELEHYPAAEFRTPTGDLVLALEPGRAGAAAVAVAGGAFRRRTETELGDPDLRTRPDLSARTAELKRIWTHPEHRRRGLSRLVVAELERRAAARGYRRVYLTTGPRQPEAVGLYLAAGYTALFDVSADPESIGPLPFEKWLCPE